MPTRAEQALNRPSTVDAALSGETVPAAATAAPAITPPPAGVATTKDGQVVFRQGGQFISVPAEDVPLVLREPNTRFATPDEWEKRIVEKETSVAEQLLSTTVTGAASGAMLAARLPAMVADIVDPGSGSDFLRETSPEGIKANFDAAWALAQGKSDRDVADTYDDSKRRERIYEELFPTARAIGRAGGETLANLALTGPLGGFVGGAKTAAGVAARSGLVGAVEGSASMAAEEYRQSYLENRAVDREHLLNNGMMGAVFGGALGAVTGYAGKRVGDYLESRPGRATVPGDTRTRAVNATERAVADNVDELDRPAVQLEQELSEMQARVSKAARDAGANPNAQQAAAEAATEAEIAQVRKIAEMDIDPATWRDAATDKVSPMTLFLHRKAYEEGATRELVQRGDEMLKGTRELTEVLKKVELKEAQVAKKLAADGVDETAAIASTQQAQRAFGAAAAEARAALDEAGVGGTKAAKLYFERMAKANTIAEKALAKTDSAAGAYIVRDQFRRSMLGLKNQVDDYVLKGAIDPYENAAIREIQPFIDREYHRAANSLFDQGTWKSMGEFQQAVNGQDGWVGMIEADKVGLRNFASTVSFGDGTNYRREILGMDPDKVRAYLSRIDQDSLRDAQIRNIIGKRAMMIRTMREGLDLTPAQAAKADRVLEAAEKSLSALDDAEKLAIKANKQAALNEAEKLSAQGGMWSKLLAGGIKALGGDVRGAAAMQVGGSEVVARHIAALRTQAQASESRMLRGILKIVDKASGEGSPNAQAVGKITKRAEQGGLINARAEKLAERMKNQGYAFAPLFKIAYDRPTAEQRDVHARRQDVLADLVANPDKLDQAVQPAIARATAASTQLGAALTSGIQERIQRLQQALPGVRSSSLLPNAPSSKVNQVSAQELRQAEGMIEVTLDPQVVFDDFLAGKLDYDKLKFAKVQSPETFEMARAVALDIFRELPADLQTNMATQLDFLLGFDGGLDPTLSPEFLKRQTERLQMRNEAVQNQPQARRAPQTGKAMVTYTQRLSGA